MRIVSLLASATEMIAELGCLDEMVGRSHECDYPPSVTHLPLVSRVQIDPEVSSAEIDAQIKHLAHAQEENALRALSIYHIDAQQLRELQPDVIVTQTQCEVCAVSERDVTAALREVTGLQPNIVSLAPYRLSDVWEDMIRLGRALGREERARQRVEDYQQRLQQLHRNAEEWIQEAGGIHPRVAVLEWLDPLMGAGNWTPELVEIAGGEHVTGIAGQHAPWLSWEELQNAQPAVLVLAPCGFTVDRTLREVDVLTHDARWQTLRAVQEGRVYVIDGNAYLNRSGPRLVESAELLASAIWGEERCALHGIENAIRRLARGDSEIP